MPQEDHRHEHHINNKGYCPPMIEHQEVASAARPARSCVRRGHLYLQGGGLTNE
jgi:hypothetical protein